MRGESQPLADLQFSARLIEWRGPSPHVFAPVPVEHVGELHHAAALASYGWGCVPVRANANGVDFTTSLFPRDGGYLVPVKAAVRKATGLAPGDAVRIRLRVFAPE